MAITHVATSSFDGLLDVAGTAIDNAFDATGGDYMLVRLAWSSSQGHTIDGVTFNGDALTSLGASIVQGAHRAQLFRLIAPDTGSHTLSVNPSNGAGADEDIVITVSVYAGVDQTTPEDGFDTTNADDGSIPYESPLTIASATGDMVYVSHSIRQLATGTATGFTERSDNQGATAISVVVGDADGAASVVTSCEWSAGGVSYCTVGINMNAAGGGGGSPGAVVDVNVIRARRRSRMRAMGYGAESGEQEEFGVGIGAGGGSGGGEEEEGGGGDPPEGVIYSSDWGTALGTTTNARGDGGAWTLVNGSLGAEVVASTGLDFPSDNVLFCRPEEDDDADPPPPQSRVIQLRKTGLGVPVSSTSRYYRVYNRVVLPDDIATSDTEIHHHQDGQAAGDYNWGFHIYHDGPTANRWYPQFRVGASENGANYRWGGVFSGGTVRGPALVKGSTYRIEWQIHRTGESTFLMHIRIYNASGTLEYSDADFSREDGTITLATNPSLNFHVVANMDGFNAGMNGLGPQDNPEAEWGSDRVDYMYQGAVAIKDSSDNVDGWLGPYSGGV